MINDQLYDVNTKQRIHHYAIIYTVYRHTLRPEEEFSVVNAARHLERNHQLRQAECVVHCLEDRLTFSRTRLQGNQPFRSWVAYKEIVAINRNTKRSDMFVLSIHSIRSQKRYYEIYRCKYKEDINLIHRLISQAMEDPEGIIRVDKQTASDPMVEQPGSRPRTMANFAYETNREDLIKDDVSTVQSRSTSPICSLNMHEPDRSSRLEKTKNVPMVQSVPPVPPPRSRDVQTSLANFDQHRLQSQATQTKFIDQRRQHEAPQMEEIIAPKIMPATMQSRPIPSYTQDQPATRIQMPMIVREEPSKSGLERAPTLIYSGGFPRSRNQMQTIERDHTVPVSSRSVARAPPVLSPSPQPPQPAPQRTFTDAPGYNKKVSFDDSDEVRVMVAKPVRIAPDPVRPQHDDYCSRNEARISLYSAKKLSASMPAVNSTGDYPISPVERRRQILNSLGSVTYLNQFSEENLISSQYGSMYMFAFREDGLNYNGLMASSDNEQEELNWNCGRTNTKEYVYRF